MSTRALWSLPVALLLLMPLVVEGQKVPPADRGPFEIFGLVGGMYDVLRSSPS